VHRDRPTRSTNSTPTATGKRALRRCSRFIADAISTLGHKWSTVSDLPRDEPLRRGIDSTSTSTGSIDAGYPIQRIPLRPAATVRHRGACPAEKRASLTPAADAQLQRPRNHARSMAPTIGSAQRQERNRPGQDIPHVRRSCQVDHTDLQCSSVIGRQAARCLRHRSPKGAGSPTRQVPLAGFGPPRRALSGTPRHGHLLVSQAFSRSGCVVP